MHDIVPVIILLIVCIVGGLLTQLDLVGLQKLVHILDRTRRDIAAEELQCLGALPCDLIACRISRRMGGDQVRVLQCGYRLLQSEVGRVLIIQKESTQLIVRQRVVDGLQQIENHQLIQG